jgi:predicted HD phosphohydrolase
MDPRTSVLIDLLESFRDAEYIGEPVSQLEHALQAAEFARAAGAPENEILASLLHDLGHLCAADDAPRMDALGVLHHEDIGADRLADLGFRPNVTDLVRSHVAAKRYLVATRPAYLARLSTASLGTLRHQGGPMTQAERAAFDADPLRDAKLRVRSWDEQAKVQGLEVPGIRSYASMIDGHLR